MQLSNSNRRKTIAACVEYTIKRHGQLLTFDLTRMNIEDIQNDTIRRMYERMLREFGPPGADRKQLQQQPSE